MKKMKQYKRDQSLPAPVPISEQRGPVAERNGHGMYDDWQGDAGRSTQIEALPPSPPYAWSPPGLAPQATYFQVLLGQLQKRWKMLFAWMVLSAALAGFVVMKYGKPQWKAEGRLYYSPNYTGNGPNPLYRPPNIQTIVALAKSPEVIEKACGDANVTENADAIDTRLIVTVVKASDLISVTFQGPNREQSVAFAEAVLEHAIEQYDQRRQQLSQEALVNLNEDLEKTRKDLLARRHELDESLGNDDIYDLKTEKAVVVSSMKSLESDIDAKQREQRSLQGQINDLKGRIKEYEANNSNRLTAEESERLKTIQRVLTEKHQLQSDIDKNKIELKTNQENYNRLRPLAAQKHVSVQEMKELEGKINISQSFIVNGNKHLQELEDSLKQLENNRVVSSQLLLLETDKFRLESSLGAIPGQIEALQAHLDKRHARLVFLNAADEKAQPIQLEIEALQSKLNSMTSQKQQHKNLEEGKLKELTINTHAAAGASPASSNHMKLAAAVFGLSLLVFVGFVAMYDMPRVLPAHAANRQQAPPGSQLPVPAWQHQMKPAQPHGPPRGPTMNNEHLRALSERIMQNRSERAAIILFTPTSGGVRVENLLGDLGCFLNRNGNRVLVFEARRDAENPSYPVWTGPSSREVAEQLEGYLEGQHERGSQCFAETLISGIDYARADLGRHLSGIMAMYRFRRLMADMKERYSVVLMITPERYQGEEDDVFTTLGEGIVVVINEDADPADVETYLRELRASETPVYGAVTLPKAQDY